MIRRISPFATGNPAVKSHKVPSKKGKKGLRRLCKWKNMKKKRIFSRSMKKTSENVHGTGTFGPRKGD